MKEWILSLCAVIVLTTVVFIILPNGKLNKIIKSIFSFIVLAVMIKPIFMLKDLSFNNSFFNDNSDLLVQYDYLKFIAEEKIDKYKKASSEILEQNGIYGGKISFEYFFDEYSRFIIKKVYINLTEAVIISDKEHIDIIKNIKADISKLILYNSELEFVINE